MHNIVEMPWFLRRAKECGVSEEERAEMVDFIARNPTGGDEIPGTNGARKMRFARPGQGKRGGYRIITFYGGNDIPVFLMTMFAKNEASNMSQAGKNELKKILQVLPDSYRRMQHEKNQANKNRS